MLNLTSVAPVRQLHEIAVHLARIDLDSTHDLSPTNPAIGPREPFAYLIVPFNAESDAGKLDKLVPSGTDGLPILVTESTVNDQPVGTKQVLVGDIMEGKA